MIIWRYFNISYINKSLSVFTTSFHCMYVVVRENYYLPIDTNIVWTFWSINMIWQQTNVYPNAQKRKVRPFEGMIRKAIVIVPSDEDYKARIEAQEKEETKDVPDNAVMEMKGIAKDKLTFAVVILIFHELLRNFSKQFSSYIFILYHECNQISSLISYQTYIVIYYNKDRNEEKFELL